MGDLVKGGMETAWRINVRMRGQSLRRALIHDIVCGWHCRCTVVQCAMCGTACTHNTLECHAGEAVALASN